MEVAGVFLRDMARALRYVAAPTVALVVVWLVDSDHDVVIAMTRTGGSVFQTGSTYHHLTWDNVGSWWPVVLFVLIGGVFTYQLHEATAHRFIAWAFIRMVVRYSKVSANKNPRPSLSELAFARWHRRGMKRESPERATQDILDEANSAAHFFFCSAWSLLLFMAVLSFAFRPYFSATDDWNVYLIVSCVFIFLGLITEWRTTKLDLEAFDRFPSCRGRVT